jgi:hypothetical protein
LKKRKDGLYFERSQEVQPFTKRWFCVYPRNRTGREAIRNNKVKRKITRTGNNLHKTDFDKAKETSIGRSPHF